MYSAKADIVARNNLPGMSGRPGLIFALLDGTQLPERPDRIDALGPSAVSLFKGAAAERLRDVAPYLVRLPGDAPLLAALLTGSLAPDAICEHVPGILIQSDLGPEALRQHFRRLMRVEASGQHYLFRFWDPTTAAAYFDAVTDSEDRGRWFFPREGGRIEAILVPERGSGNFRAYRAGVTPKLHPWHARPFRMRDQELAALQSTHLQEEIGQLAGLMTSTFPQLATQIGPDMFDTMIRRAILRCAGLGIRQRANIFRIVAWDLHARGNFEDVDPAAELGRILCADLSETEKMQRLIARIASLAPANCPAAELP